MISPAARILDVVPGGATQDQVSHAPLSQPARLHQICRQARVFLLQALHTTSTLNLDRQSGKRPDHLTPLYATLAKQPGAWQTPLRPPGTHPRLDHVHDSGFSTTANEA